MLKISDLINFILPRRCVMCNSLLASSERHICTDCLSRLPRTEYHRHDGNPIEQIFWGQVPIERASSFFFYQGEHTRRILHSLKYFDNPSIGRYLGNIYAEELIPYGFFKDIDGIIPVPLHWRKTLKRGYNQSEYFAYGISDATGLPTLDKAMKRTVNTRTQTRLHKSDRWSNVQDIFTPNKGIDESYRHILIIDDVITTGATTLSLMRSIHSAYPDIVFSVLSLAYAGEFINVRSDDEKTPQSDDTTDDE